VRVVEISRVFEGRDRNLDIWQAERRVAQRNLESRLVEEPARGAEIDAYRIQILPRWPDVAIVFVPARQIHAARLTVIAPARDEVVQQQIRQRLEIRVGAEFLADIDRVQETAARQATEPGPAEVARHRDARKRIRNRRIVDRAIIIKTAGQPFGIIR